MIQYLLFLGISILLVCSVSLLKPKKHLWPLSWHQEQILGYKLKLNLTALKWMHDRQGPKLNFRLIRFFRGSYIKCPGQFMRTHLQAWLSSHYNHRTSYTCRSWHHHIVVHVCWAGVNFRTWLPKCLDLHHDSMWTDCYGVSCTLHSWYG